MLIYTNDKRRNWWIISGLGALWVLFFSYSRSALLGAVLAVFIVVWLLSKQAKLKKYLMITAAVLAVLGAGGLYTFRHNDRVQNTFFHTDEHSRSSESSNFDRLGHLKDGLHDVIHKPWGDGPGTAGPASVRNPHETRIAENYFLQIGQEVGVIGMLIFVAINLLVALALWQRGDGLSIALFASLIGLTLVNMLSHAWGDDTLGLLWWGLAGIALGNGILETNSEQPKWHSKKSNAKK